MRSVLLSAILWLMLAGRAQAIIDPPDPPPLRPVWTVYAPLVLGSGP